MQKNKKALALVEATQSAEVLFVRIGEILILKVQLPDLYSIIGIGLIITRMLLHSLKK